MVSISRKRISSPKGIRYNEHLGKGSQLPRGYKCNIKGLYCREYIKDKGSAYKIRVL